VILLIGLNKMDKGKKFWDNRVEKYGELSTGYLDRNFYEYDDSLRWSLFRKSVTKKKGSKILDVGCNHGRWSYKMYDLGFKIYGFDISSKAIELAKKNKGKRKIEFFYSKAVDIKFEKNYFDVIVSVTVLQHILDKKEFEKSLKKLIDITKKGGEIFLIESAPMKKKVRKLNYKEEWTLSNFRKIFEENGCYLEKTRGLDFVGYYIFCFFDIFFQNNDFMKKIERLCLIVAKPFDKLLLNFQFFTKFSNTKMIKFIKE